MTVGRTERKLLALGAFALLFSSLLGGGAAVATMAHLGTVDVAEPLAQQFVIAVIGDYGYCHVRCTDQQAVADMIHRWQPDAILTVGDNSYEGGRPDEVTGAQQPYAEDVEAGRFYPVSGNHDWDNRCDPKNIIPSLEYFGRPVTYVAHFGNGLVDLFATDTTCTRTNSRGETPPAAAEYAEAVGESSATWRIAAGHHPVYSSGRWGNHDDRRWILNPFVDLYLFGHDHDSEHILRDGQHFVVTGVGGKNLTPLGAPIPGSLWGDDQHFGAARITAKPRELAVEYFAADGRVLHAFTLAKTSAFSAPYMTQLSSARGPWWNPDVEAAGGVVIRSVAGRYLAVLGPTGKVVRLPASLVKEKLLYLSVFLESAIARRVEPEELLDSIPDYLQGLSQADRPVLVRLYAELIEMERTGKFGSIWAKLLRDARF